MAKVGNRVKETSTTTGTGTLDLLGAPTGFRAFLTEFVTTDRVSYLIVDDPDNPTDYEIGIGTTAAAGDTAGIGDGCDNCPSTSNADQRDFDLDGVGDVCDPDVDGDGVLNGSDLCAETVVTPVDTNGCSQAQVDQDLDGICDPGSSSPTLCTGSDNCPQANNPGQENVVHPATTDGDACEDPDVDTWVDRDDNCPDDSNIFQLDFDLDGFGEECDPCPANPDCDSDTVSDGPDDPDGGGPIVAGPDN